MSLRAVSRLLSVFLLSVGPFVALANTSGDVPPSLRAAIEKATYQIEPEGKAGTNAAYVASNQAQGMKVSFTSSGVLVSGASSGERWNLGMKLKSWGYGKKTRSVRPARLAVLGDRIEYRRGPLAEWYSNSEAGLEQGFTLHAPPAAVHRSGTLRLRLALSGNLTPSLAQDGGGLLLARAGGERVLRFAGLKAFDAVGRSLPSRMELRGGELALLVDDRAAVYPVTVDPLLTKETKLTASDAAAGDEFGFSVAVSGDTAVVGAFFGDSGSAYVYEPASTLLTALSPARVWVGLKNSDAVGLRLDLLAEVFVNATKVEQGELDNVGGGSSGFKNALLNTIPLALTGGPVSAPSGAQLSIKVSARRTCFGGRHNSGTARLWYNGKPVDSGAIRDVGSRFDATIGGTTNDYFLRSGSSLSTTPGSSRTSADAFVNSSAPCPARPFTSFGTWSSILP